MINISPGARKIFYVAFNVALVGLFFVGSFAIKRNFLPLIFLGTISFALLVCEIKDSRVALRENCFTPFFFCITALVVWMALSTFWGIKTPSQLLAVMRFASNLILAWFVFVLMPTLSEDRAKILKNLLLSVFIGILFIGIIDIIYTIAKGIPARESLFRRNIILLLSMFWPISYYIKEDINGGRKYLLLGGVFIAIALLAFKGPISVAIYAFLAGFISFLFVYYKRYFFYIILFFSVFLFCCILPSILLIKNPAMLVESLQDVFPTSWQHRIFIWSTVLEKFLDCPFFGWGAEAARHMEIDVSNEAVLYFKGIPFSLSSEELLPIHAHQGWLQIMMEMGVVGMMLSISCFVAGAWQVSRLYKKAFPWMAATFFTLLVPFSISFGLWQTSWISIWIYSIFCWRLIMLHKEAKRNKSKYS